jgi:AcrR family transcriptional regulator
MVFTQRSRPARDAILRAARDEFAAVGFDRSTVRSVAATAKVDPAMVIRYYGSKEGLFADAVDVDLALPAPGTGADLGRLLGRHFVDLWEGSRSDGTLQILLRSVSASPQIAERIRSVFADQVAAWVRSAPGLTADDSNLRAARVATYVLGTALCRYILALPPLAGLSPDELAEEIGSTLQLLLDAEV